MYNSNKRIRLMPSSISIDQNYIKLAQLVCLLKNKHENKDHIMEIVNSNYNLNYSVPRDSPVQISYFESPFIGNTILHFFASKSPCCAFKKQSLTLYELLKRGADFTLKNQNGSTPIHLAFEYKTKQEIIDQLLEAHVEFRNPTNPRDKNGMSHMHIACHNGNLKVVKFFLESGVSANDSINIDSKIYPGCSALHLAAMNFHKEIVELLLKHGADVNCLNADKISPLYWLIKQQVHCGCHFYMRFERILDSIMIQNAHNSNPIDSNGITRFHVYNSKIYEFETKNWNAFLNAGVNINSPINFDSPILPGYTPLHIAAHCSLRTVKLLLMNGANLLAKDAKGTTPLDICVYLWKPIEISNALKAVDAFKTIKFNNGAYLLDVLSAFDNKDLLKDYLKNIENTTIPFNSPLWPGSTILHIAVLFLKFNQLSAVELCLKHGADVTIEDANGMTALNLAFRKGNHKCMRAIFNRINNLVNPIDHNNILYFHLSCLFHDLRKVRHYLSLGVDPNVPIEIDLDEISSPNKIKAGSTPLDIAIAIGSKELIEMLLECGADPTILDADGFTCVQRLFLSGYNDYYFEHLLWLHPKALDSNPKAPNGLSHFHIACYKSDLRAVTALLPLVTDINEPINCKITIYLPWTTYLCNGDTPLHVAINSPKCSEELLDVLLRNGADIGVKNEDGLNPIDLALFRYLKHQLSPKIIRRLALEVKNNIKLKNWTYTLKDVYFIKKLLHAECDYEDVEDNDIEEGHVENNDVEDEDAEDEDVEDNDVENGDESSDDDEVSFLIFNYSKDYIERKLLIRYSEDQRLFVNKDGLSSFHVACVEDDFDTIKKFIQLGVDINAPKNHFAATYPGFTSLHFSVNRGNARVVELLMEHGADINLKDSMGNTPVHLAAQKHPSLIKLLLRERKFNLKTKNAFGKTVMDSLFHNELINVIAICEILEQILITKSIEAASTFYLVAELFVRLDKQNFESLINRINDISDADGINVIHHIFNTVDGTFFNNFEDSVDKLKILVNRGCDLDFQDKEGKTPLQRAALMHDYQKVNILLFIGANINIADNYGQTPNSCYVKGNCYSFEAFDTHVLLNEYVSKLKTAGLQVNPMNDHCDDEDPDMSLELSEMKQTVLGKGSTIRSILTEQIVMRSPMMPKRDRQAIIDYIDSDDLQRQFKDWVPLFNFQRRRILKRLSLFKPAFNALRDVLGPRLPDHCVELILVNLSNENWQNCIKNKKL